MIVLMLFLVLYYESMERRSFQFSPPPLSNTSKIENGPWKVPGSLWDPFLVTLSYIPYFFSYFKKEG